MRKLGNINSGFQTEFRIESLRAKRNHKLREICNRKSGYCLVNKRIMRPSESNVMLGDYGYYWKSNRADCIAQMERELGLR